MIESISLKDFQSHGSSVFELHPGLNVIVGRSDSGKTAVIRALNWLMFNKPGGAEFISHWSNGTEVVAIIDGVPVVRSRNKTSKNEYSLDGETLKAFGSNVPDEVMEFLNVSRLNFQLQMDSPFLLTESPGAVAKYFNEIVSLDIVDRGIANINKWHRAINSRITVMEEDLKGYLESIKVYDELDDVEAVVNEIEELYSKYETTVENTETLENIVYRYEKNKRRQVRYSNIVLLEDDVSKLFSLAESYNKLDLICDELEELQERISETEQLLTVDIKVINEIISLLEELKEAKKKFKQMSLIVSKAEKVSAAREDAADMVKRYTEELAAIPQICPECGQPYPDHGKA